MPASVPAAPSPRAVAIVMTPEETNEARGVTIRRTIGSEKLVLLDPFLLLDHMAVPPATGGGTESVGFPRHPHRGIETLTYMFAGRVHHRDSMGNDDSIGAHESQWMTAGGGLYHSEMLEAGAEGNEGLQLWFNLPAAEKMKRPAYRAAREADIPVVTTENGATVRVVAGEFGGATGPFEGIAVRPTLLDVHLPAGQTVTLPAPPGETAFAYLYRGAARFGPENTPAAAPVCAILTDGDGLRATAPGDGEARFLLVSATPTREPVVQYRSLVMNTVEEMKQALDDLQNDTFARS